MRHERGVEQRIFELVGTVPPDSLLSPLRDLARDELAAGHDREGLIEDFEHVRSALREKELEEQEDVVMEVMDFLYGWCSPHLRIPAPSEPLPAEPLPAEPLPAEPPRTSVGRLDPVIVENVAARRFADILADSYRTAYEQAAEAQRSQTRLAREISERVVENLRRQTEESRAVFEELAGQTRRQQKARELAQETVEAYADLLEEAVSRYAEAFSRYAAEQPPIDDYDELNVDEIAQRLEGLSPEELERIRAYERRNKNRATLFEQIDRKLGGIS